MRSAWTLNVILLLEELAEALSGAGEQILSMDSAVTALM